MTPAAEELAHLCPGLFIWQNYHPAVKAELFSTGIEVPAGVYLIDPIPLADSQLSWLPEGSVVGVVVTNTNHQRASLFYSEKFSAPIFAHRETFPGAKPPSLIDIADGTKISEEFETIEIEGAALGEIALYQPGGGGTLIVGDALINFEPYGFTFLPRKYCINEKKMRQSLRKLLTRKAERLLFAHGAPILSGASMRLQNLLGVDL